MKFGQSINVGGYYPDFVFSEIKLIVEIDGAYHWTSGQMLKDKTRTRHLEDKGYEVIRFTNKEARHRTKLVVDSIQNAVHDLAAHGMFTLQWPPEVQRITPKKKKKPRLLSDKTKRRRRRQRAKSNWKW